MFCLSFRERIPSLFLPSEFHVRPVCVGYSPIAPGPSLSDGIAFVRFIYMEAPERAAAREKLAAENKALQREAQEQLRRENAAQRDRLKRVGAVEDDDIEDEEAGRQLMK